MTHLCLFTVAIDEIDNDLFIISIVFSLTTLIPERQVWIRKNKWRFTSLLLKTLFFIVGYHYWHIR